MLIGCQKHLSGPGPALKWVPGVCVASLRVFSIANQFYYHLISSFETPAPNAVGKQTKDADTSEKRLILKNRGEALFGVQNAFSSLRSRPSTTLVTNGVVVETYGANAVKAMCKFRGGMGLLSPSACLTVSGRIFDVALPVKDNYNKSTFISTRRRGVRGVHGWAI